MQEIRPALLLVSITALLYMGIAFAELQRTKMTVNGIHSPIQVEVATSRLDDVKLEHGIYIFKIYCALDTCSVERMSLNECVQDKNGKLSFTPKTYSWTSQAGFLEASLSGNILEVIVFQATHHQLPAKILLTFDSITSVAPQLKSFKASGFIDSRLWPDTNSRFEYVPIEGDQWKQLDCPVFLPGIKGRRLD